MKKTTILFQKKAGEKGVGGVGMGNCNPMVPMVNGDVPLNSIMSAADAQMRIGWDPSESGNKTSPQHYLVQGERGGGKYRWGGGKCRWGGGKLQMGWWEWKWGDCLIEPMFCIHHCHATTLQKVQTEQKVLLQT